MSVIWVLNQSISNHDCVGDILTCMLGHSQFHTRRFEFSGENCCNLIAHLNTSNLHFFVGEQRRSGEGQLTLSKPMLDPEMPPLRSGC